MSCNTEIVIPNSSGVISCSDHIQNFVVMEEIRACLCKIKDANIQSAQLKLFEAVNETVFDLDSEIADVDTVAVFWKGQLRNKDDVEFPFTIANESNLGKITFTNSMTGLIEIKYQTHTSIGELAECE